MQGRLITWISAFFVAVFAVIPFLFLLLQPLDFTLLQIRLYPGSVALAVGVWIFIMALLAWVLGELKKESFIKAYILAGKKTRLLRTPLVLGFLLLVILAFVFQINLSGKMGQIALAKASEKLGPNYKYFVSALQVNYSSQGKLVSATVTAYNDQEIRVVPLRWSER